jgi:hypothetical protein
VRQIVLGMSEITLGLIHPIAAALHWVSIVSF